MDYFQSTHQQPSNTGGPSGNQQQHQHQQQPQQHHQQQQQQYHQYNGMQNQHNTPSQNNSQLYYQQQQQQQQQQHMYSQAQQSHNFTIQPASANAPLDHGSQQQHNQSSYHHTSSSHNNGSHHQQQQQSAHHNSSIQSLQQQHQHHQQHHAPQQSHQQQSQLGSVGGGGNHMNYSQVHHTQQRRGPVSSLMNTSSQNQGQSHHQNPHQQQSNQQQHNPHQSQQQQHHAQNQHQQQIQHHQHQAHQQHNQHHQQQQPPHQQSQQPQQQQSQQQIGSSNVSGGQQQHAGGQQMNPAFMLPPGPPMGVPLKELPVRIVIDSKYVGAVIGQGGAQIREITKDSHAKVVVETQKAGPKDAQGNTEKVINVSGSPDNCTRAVSKILEVVQRELQKDDANDSSSCELKIRAHNQLVGRLIGKQGATIKKIMSETGTTILVSNDQQNRPDMQPPYNHNDIINMIERTISVKGPAIENVTSAEARISAKLKKCFDTDSHHRMQAFQSNLPGGSMMNPALIQQMSAGGDPYSVMNAQRNGGPSLLANNMKSVRMWVPDSMVGALIGSKGKNIKTIIRESGANVKIESPDEKEKRDAEQVENGNLRKEERHDLLEEFNAENATNDSPISITDKSEDESIEKKAEERMVTISGIDIQLLKAQTLIYAKISEQGPTAYDDLKLRTEISVPSKIVGRIIGKKGQNVRELQRISGATVKIPEEEKNGTPEMVYKEKDEEDTTVVRIIGNVQASHNVQFRLAQLVSDFNRLNLEKRGETSPIHPHNISPSSK